MMKHCQLTARLGLLLFLCLFAWPVATRGQGTTPDGRTRLVNANPNGKWEKVFLEDKGVYNFKSVYMAPFKQDKSSPLRWLWVGDERGYLRLTTLDAESPALIGTDKNRGELPYFAWSKLDVTASDIMEPASRVAINALHFLDQNTGYLLKGHKLYSTDNGGFSWRLIYTAPTGPDRSVATLYSIAVTPSKRACIVGMYSLPDEVKDSLVLCTEKALTPEGVQWKAIRVPTRTQLLHVFFLDEKHGWIVGARGTILKTGTGGDTWDKSDVEAEPLLQSYFLDELNGWAVGLNGTILSTITGGKDWEPVTVNFSNQLAGITLKSIKFAPDQMHGWIVGDQGKVLYTDNRGLNWQLQQLPMTKDGKLELNALNALFVDDTFCWAVGSNSSVWRYKWK